MVEPICVASADDEGTVLSQELTPFVPKIIRKVFACAGDMNQRRIAVDRFAVEQLSDNCVVLEISLPREGMVLAIFYSEDEPFGYSNPAVDAESLAKRAELAARGFDVVISAVHRRRAAHTAAKAAEASGRLLRDADIIEAGKWAVERIHEQAERASERPWSPPTGEGGYATAFLYPVRWLLRA